MEYSIHMSKQERIHNIRADNTRCRGNSTHMSRQEGTQDTGVQTRGVQHKDGQTKGVQYANEYNIQMSSLQGV
jgi:hypothetical protein